MDRAKTAAEQWRRELPETDLLPMEILGHLGEAALLVGRNRLEPLFAKFNLQQGEFDVLATLRRSGAPYTLTPTALYDATMISSGGMTNRLDRLEKAGLIKRHPNPDDRRGTLVKLSSTGLSHINSAVHAHLANTQDIVSALTSNERHKLNALLTKLIASVI